jgi:hypothetical protein
MPVNVPGNTSWGVAAEVVGEFGLFCSSLRKLFPQLAPITAIAMIKIDIFFMYFFLKLT